MPFRLPCFVRARLLACLLALPALAAGQEPVALSLPAAETLALREQPLLEAQRATVRAGRERAVAMRQLPDPMLVAGVQNLPVNGEDRFDLGAEPMTMTGVGLMQAVPLPAKRRLRGRAESLMADAGEAKLAELERRVRRETAMAWLAAWFPQRAAGLARAMAAEADRERLAAEIAYRAGRAPQADMLAADVELEMLRDRVRKLEQDGAEARERLARWTGEVVSAVADDSPALPDPAPLPELLASLERHPELVEASFDVATADNALALAREMYWPDWRIEAMYGWRPDFNEMVTVQIGIDLPLFTGRRQDRKVAAARHALAGSQASRDDMSRQLRTMTGAAYRAWEEGRARLARYDEAIVPRAQARAEAALAAYRAGKNELMAVIGARRAALEAALMQLELQMEVAERLIELRYLDVREN